MHTSRSRGASAPAIRVTEHDYDQLSDLLDGLHTPSAGAALLIQELDRASIVPKAYRGARFVRLNSLVEYEDVESGHRRRLRVVLPQHARIEDNSISVLSPAGAALMGLTAGQTMHWEVADGRTQTFKVLAVTHDEVAD